MQDLSDKTDHQVHKIVQVIDKKSSDIQTNMALIDAKIANVEGLIIRATEISKAAAQQMPPQNISDMQKTSLHVQAAKLANQGFSKEQIGDKVDLNPAEIDLIFKVNKDHLQFAEDQLPGWVGGMTVDNNELSAFGNLIKAQKATARPTVPMATAAQATAFTSTAQNVSVATVAQSNLVSAIPGAAATFATQTQNLNTTNTINNLGSGMPRMTESTVINASSTASANGIATNNKATITPYIFKKIDPDKV